MAKKNRPISYKDINFMSWKTFKTYCSLLSLKGWVKQNFLQKSGCIDEFTVELTLDGRIAVKLVLGEL
jgi:hypothetical protein